MIAAIVRGSSALVFGLLLWGSYAIIVAEANSYLGFTYVAPEPWAMVWALAMGVGSAVALPARLSRLSDFALWTLWVLAVGPSILMAPYTGYLSTVQGFALSTSLALLFSVVALALRFEGHEFRLSASSGWVWALLLVHTALVLVLIGVTSGLSLEVVDLLFGGYDLRMEFSDAVDEIPLLGYLFTWQTNVVNPAILALGIAQRNWAAVIFGLLVQYVLFTSTGFKMVLFSIGVLLALTLLFSVRSQLLRWRHKLVVAFGANPLRAPSALWVLWGAIALIGVSWAVDAAFQTYVMTHLLPRRAIMAPGMLTSAYVSFFETHPQAHLAHSVLRGFFDYPYSVLPPRLIGMYIMPSSPSLMANGNIFADGFANFGWAGLVAVAVLLLAVLWVADRVSQTKPMAFTSVVFALPVVALANSALLTTLLTHGLLLAIVVIAIAPVVAPGQLLETMRARRGLRRFSRRSS